MDASWVAGAIQRAYDAYQEEFRRITALGRARFEARDWRGAQQDSVERLEARPRFVQACVDEIVGHFGMAAADRALWAGAKRVYAARAKESPDGDLAFTFFNSINRRVLFTVGVDAAVEFVDADFEAMPRTPGPPVYERYPWSGDTVEVVRRILRDVNFSVPWAGVDEDAQLAAAEIDSYLRNHDAEHPVDAFEIASAVFYRNKGAYLVGRIRRGPEVTPLIFALLHGDEGVFVDAVLLAPEDASIVFSFTHSYFRVEIDRSRDLVQFLATILPQKPISEIYASVGNNKHGKTELYRELTRHLGHTTDQFVPARGARGMVMLVFTLPSLDIVFKVIRDRFAYPKSTTRQEVMSKYQLVFRHDRAGRLVDAQEFEHMAFDRARFSPELLDELLSEAGETARLEGGRVVIRHLYTERRVVPLDLYIREQDEWTARHAVLDYGQSIRDLVATNTFPGDLLLKNFGVTRNRRVIFYDYDELCLVTDCNFRDMPTASGADEEMSGEPWFYVGENDIFPEEFIKFLGLSERLREVFVATHGEVLTARFWRDYQERHRAGEIVDIFPYKQSQRLRPDRR